MPMMSIGRALGVLAERAPDRLLVSDERESLSRLQFERRTNRLARAYVELGVRRDDFVAIALPNGVELMAAEMAAWKAGATPLLISHAMPAAERAAIVELARPRLLVGASPDERSFVRAVPAGFDPDPSYSDRPLEQDQYAKYRRALTSGGSTGRPKIIVTPIPAVADPDMRFAGFFPWPDDDACVLVAGPLYHTAHISVANTSLLGGIQVAIMPRFDAEQTLAWIERYRACFTVLVPTMMHRIWRLGAERRAQYDLGSLLSVMHTAAPCPDWLKQAFIDWLGPERVLEVYGSTESVLTTVIGGSEWLEHRGSVGRVPKGLLKVVDAQGHALPVGEVGDIYVRRARGQERSYFYIGAEASSRGEWETLGDVGWLDADGYLFLADRKADMIISGGANVYPAEVEAAIEAHPAVRSSAVIGLPDEDLGQRIHAIVDIAGRELDEPALRDFLGQRLVRYKIPRSFEWVHEPLRNDAGKVRRSALRAERLAAFQRPA